MPPLAFPRLAPVRLPAAELTVWVCGGLLLRVGGWPGGGTSGRRQSSSSPVRRAAPLDPVWGGGTGHRPHRLTCLGFALRRPLLGMGDLLGRGDLLRPILDRPAPSGRLERQMGKLSIWGHGGATEPRGRAGAHRADALRGRAECSGGTVFKSTQKISIPFQRLYAVLFSPERPSGTPGAPLVGERKCLSSKNPVGNSGLAPDRPPKPTKSKVGI